MPPKSDLQVAGAPVDARIRITASSSYPGSPAENAIDGKVETSWYSATNDSVARGGTPFVELELPSPTTLRRVTIMGNRDPAFPRGFTIDEGRLELFDATGLRQLATSGTGVGVTRDFDFRLPRPIEGIKRVRFTSTRDQGHKSCTATSR